MRDTKDWIVLIACILVSEGAGAIGSFFTIPSIPTWYATLIKPDIAPPNWIFGPVWTTLFLLMGVAAFIVWRNAASRRDLRIAAGIFALQLVLNIVWSLVFFGLQDPGKAFIELIFFWFAIAATIVVFARTSKLAAWLLSPYIVWVSFAGYLNYMIWILNS